MRGVQRARRDRQLVFIGQLRRGAEVTLNGFVEYLDRHMPRLRASKKTIHRDVIDLRDRMHAPIIYVPAEHTYRLEDPDWQFPVDLHEEGLMPTLMCMRIASPLPPMPSMGALQEVVQALLAASDPDTIDKGMLDSLVHATTVGPALDPAICATVETAWREQRQCRIRYAAMDKNVSERVVEIHGVFLADGAWYTRAWCCNQDAARSFALHRIQQAELLPDHFDRRPQLVESISRGEVFDDAAVAGVIIHCSAEKAPLIREREWFPGQSIVDLPDGGLELHYATAPRDRLVWWVMGYAGALTLRAPCELRDRIADLAGQICRQHTEDSP